MDPNNYPGYPPYSPYPAADDYAANSVMQPPYAPYTPDAQGYFGEPYAAPAYSAPPYIPQDYTAPYNGAVYADQYADPVAYAGGYAPTYAPYSRDYSAPAYTPADYLAPVYPDPYAAPVYAPAPQSGYYTSDYPAAPVADYAAIPYAPTVPVAPPYYTGVPAQPVAQPLAPPVAQPVAPPVAQPVAPPVAQPVAPPVAQPVAPPVAQPVAPTVAQPVTSPTGQPVAQPETQPAAQPVTQPAASPVAQTPERVDAALPLPTPKKPKKAVVLDLSREELRQAPAETEPNAHAEAEAKAEREPATVAEPVEVETEVELKADGESEIETEVKVEREPKPAAEPVEVETEVELKEDGKVEAETELEVERKSETVEPVAESVEVETEVELKEGGESEIETELEVERKSEIAKPVAEPVEVETEVELKEDGESEIETEVKVEREPKPAAEPVEVETEVELKEDGKVEAETELKTESEPETDGIKREETDATEADGETAPDAFAADAARETEKLGRPSLFDLKPEILEEMSLAELFAASIGEQPREESELKPAEAEEAGGEEDDEDFFESFDMRFETPGAGVFDSFASPESGEAASGEAAEPSTDEPEIAAEGAEDEQPQSSETYLFTDFESFDKPRYDGMPTEEFDAIVLPLPPAEEENNELAGETADEIADEVKSAESAAEEDGGLGAQEPDETDEETLSENAAPQEADGDEPAPVEQAAELEPSEGVEDAFASFTDFADYEGDKAPEPFFESFEMPLPDADGVVAAGAATVDIENVKTHEPEEDFVVENDSDEPAEALEAIEEAAPETNDEPMFEAPEEEAVEPETSQIEIESAAEALETIEEAAPETDDEPVFEAPEEEAVEPETSQIEIESAAEALETIEEAAPETTAESVFEAFVAPVPDADGVVAAGAATGDLESIEPHEPEADFAVEDDSDEPAEAEEGTEAAPVFEADLFTIPADFEEPDVSDAFAGSFDSLELPEPPAADEIAQAAQELEAAQDKAEAQEAVAEAEQAVSEAETEKVGEDAPDVFEEFIETVESADTDAFEDFVKTPDSAEDSAHETDADALTLEPDVVAQPDVLAEIAEDGGENSIFEPQTALQPDAFAFGEREDASEADEAEPEAFAEPGAEAEGAHSEAEPEGEFEPEAAPTDAADGDIFSADALMFSADAITSSFVEPEPLGELSLEIPEPETEPERDSQEATEGSQSAFGEAKSEQSEVNAEPASAPETTDDGIDGMFAEFTVSESADDVVSAESGESPTPDAPADFFSADDFGEIAAAGGDRAGEPFAERAEALMGALDSGDIDSFGAITEPIPAQNDADTAADDDAVAFEDDFAGFDDSASAQLDIAAENDAPSGFAVVEDGAAVAEPEGFEGFGAFDDFAAEPDGAQFAVSDDPHAAPVAGNLFDTNIMQMPLRRDENSVDSIARTLDRELLARAYNQVFTDNNLMPEGDAPNLTVRELDGEYYIGRAGAEPDAMYKPFSLTLGEGSCCALVSDLPLAAHTLAGDIAGRYDAADESVSLAEGRSGARREIVYLDSDAMLPDDLTSGEYLALALSPVSTDAAMLAGEAASLLSQVGLGDMEGEPLRDLSHNKRMLILALSAAVNPRVGALIINDSLFNIEGVEENIAKRVFALLGANRKSALLACCSPYLLGTVCNRVVALSRGEKAFDGNYHDFIDRYCLGIMSFTTSDPAGTLAAINRDFANVAALCKGSLVYLVKDGAGDVDIDALIDAAETAGADPASIVMDEKTFETACKEVFESV